MPYLRDHISVGVSGADQIFRAVTVAPEPPGFRPPVTPSSRGPAARHGVRFTEAGPTWALTGRFSARTVESGVSPSLSEVIRRDAWSGPVFRRVPEAERESAR
ncbi:hypothetical protein GCM10023196_021170 [Actinoallomurus vinaceus]|uniref:Uncharacterized protein n=1 Tax=Actinoallomurus vinaceus TaxID=1080074 RepID=A0ABP8U8G3_9ACTN